MDWMNDDDLVDDIGGMLDYERRKNDEQSYGPTDGGGLLLVIVILLLGFLFLYALSTCGG